MKYAVVTGSTKGIGRAIAERLLREGWFVFVNYAHDAESAAKFSDDFKSSGGGTGYIEIIQADLSSYEGAQRLIERVREKTDRIHALILNAGATDRTPFEEITRENWEKVINTNLNCPFYLAHDLYPEMAEGEGRIIFVGSVCGIYPHAVSPAYGVSKAASHQLAKELVKFYAPKGVTVNAIVPGFTDTPWQKNKAPEHRKRIEDKMAIGRFIFPEEIAALCWQVIQNPAINGANLQIDGGYCYR